MEKIIYDVAIALGITAGILSFSTEFAGALTYGWYLSDKQIGAILENNMDKMRLNQFADHILSDPYSAGYVAHKSLPLISKWYIAKVGMIPRWSKWSKVLDEKRDELLAMNHHNHVL